MIIIRYIRRIFVAILIAPIWVYQHTISPFTPAVCRFTPTCSAYAVEAYEKRGFLAGTVLTVWRVLRCNPFCTGGYDPVPERGFRRVKREDLLEGISLAAEDPDSGPDGAATGTETDR